MNVNNRMKVNNSMNLNDNINNNNMNNNSNYNCNIIYEGFIKNNYNFNDIFSLYLNNFQKNEAHKEIVRELKNRYKGEWFVAFEDDNDNYEFKFSGLELKDLLIFRCQQKIIYIYKYI